MILIPLAEEVWRCWWPSLQGPDRRTAAVQELRGVSTLQVYTSGVRCCSTCVWSADSGGSRIGWLLPQVHPACKSCTIGM